MKKSDQHEILLNLLRSYHGDYTPLPEILKLQISQYGRVINDLRKRGYVIENKFLGVFDGRRHTGFRLVYEPSKDYPTPIKLENNQYVLV